MPSIKFAFLLIVPVQFSLFCSLEIFHDLFRTEFIRFMSGTLAKHFILFRCYPQAFIDAKDTVPVEFYMSLIAI